MKILLIDDSPSELLLLRARLRRIGHEIVTATNGETGLQAFIDEKPDLVFLDVIMTGIDGHETARRMRAEEPDWIPIIFLSGQTDSRDIAEGIAAGGDDYLSKPCDPVLLDAKMASMQRIAEMRGRLVDTSRRLEEANLALALAAQTDGLTGLGNRRALDEALLRELARSTRSEVPVSLVLVDVDHFKLYNDRYGHLAGDECLKSVALALGRSVRRPADFAGRYGGEEFCLVLPETPATQAIHVAELARQAIKALALPGGLNGSYVTASFGIATSCSPGPAKPDSILGDADHALYAAKHAGRDCIRHADLQRVDQESIQLRGNFAVAE
jgi:diguanylate cyclase (GGDEF)-like protein